jgi:hypothetical protein
MKRPIPFNESFNTLNRREKALLKEVLISVQEFVKNSPRISDVTYATRDAHAKSYAYLKGSFQPHPDSPFRHLFDQSYYESIIRFSHAHLKIVKTDNQLPLYGLAVKIRSRDLEEINYPLVNFPVFVTNSVMDFLKLFREINFFLIKNGSEKLYSFLKIGFFILPILGDMMNLSFFKAVKNWIKTYSEFILNRNYHSIGAYRMGNKIIKLKMVPMDLNYVSNPSKTTFENISDFLFLRPIHYQLKAKIAFDEKFQPINKLTQDWTDSDEVLLGNFHFTRVIETDEENLEELSFNPFDNPDIFQPVGKIQQLRKEVYHTSIQTRNNLNRNSVL